MQGDLLTASDLFQDLRWSCQEQTFPKALEKTYNCCYYIIRNEKVKKIKNFFNFSTK